MMRKYLPTLMMIAALGFTGIVFTGCSDSDGPAEKAGQSIDNAVDSAKDAVDKDGPVEKAGQKIDDTFDSDDDN